MSPNKFAPTAEYAALANVSPMTVVVSYSLVTSDGVSNSAGHSSVLLEPHQAATYYPSSIPKEVTGWIPEYINEQGVRQALGVFLVTQNATLSASDVRTSAGIPRTMLLSRLSGGSNPLSLSTSQSTSGVSSTGLVNPAAPELATVTLPLVPPAQIPGGIDPARGGLNPIHPGIGGTPAAQDGAASQNNTGITPPDAELEGVVPIGQALLAPGDYQVRLTKLSIDPDDDSEDESAPGPPATITVPSGQYLRVKPPRENYNWIPNAELSQRRTVAALTPSDWEYPQVEGVTVRTDIPGVQEFVDETLSIADVDIVRTGKVDVTTLPTATNRIVIEVSDYTSGRIDYVLREHLADSTVVDTVLGSIAAQGKVDIITRIGGPSVTGVEKTWSSGVIKAQFVVRLIGSDAEGQRELSARVKHAGMASGKTIPRKRVRQRRREVRALPAYGTPIGRPTASPISFLGFTKKTTTTPSTSAIADKPVSVQAGDVMLAWVHLNIGPSTTVMAPPSGWTLVGETIHPNIGRQVVYRKTATSSEPDNYTFAWSAPTLPSAGQTNSLIVIEAYAGVDNANPIDATAAIASTTYQADLPIPSVNVSAPRAMLVFGYGSTQSQAWTHPSGTTERVDAHDDFFAPSLGISEAVQVTPGASVTRNATADSTLFGMSRTIALRPSGAPVPIPSTEIAFRSASSNQSLTTSASGSVTKPPGIVADDLLVLAINRSGTGAITPPAGFTEAVNTTYPTVSPQGRFAIYYKKATGAEGASYSFSFTGACFYVAEMAAYSGVHTTTPLDVSASVATTTQIANEISCPSVTSTTAATRVVCAYGAVSALTIGSLPRYGTGYGRGYGLGSNADNWTAPTGMTERADRAGRIPLSISDVGQASAGATGAKLATSEVHSFLVGATVVLRPVTTTPSPPPPPPPPIPPPLADLLPPPLQPPQVAPIVEEPGAPYPMYGYTKVVLSASIADLERPVWTTSPSVTYIPGNMIEFYGPPGIPVISSFFMSGMKLPVSAEEVRTLSFHAWYQGVSEASTPFKVLLRDNKHRLLSDFGAFEDLEGITGDSADEIDADDHGWVRRSITVEIPPIDPDLDITHSPAYLEIVASGMGGGLMRVMGAQMELGMNMTDFSLEHDLSGSITNVFDLWIPGVPHGAMPTLAQISRFIRIAAEITHVGDWLPTPLTSHVVEARTKNYSDPNEEAYWSAWTSDPATLPIPEGGGYVMVRTTVNTTDALVTPVLHSQYVEFERDNPHGSAYGSLCRSDGTEFDGSVVVYNFPPIRSQNPILTEEFADRSHGFSVMGKKTRWARGFAIEVYLNSTSEEIMELIGEDPEQETTDNAARASVFCVEVYGKRYAARILDLELLSSEDREAHLPVPTRELDGMWLMHAEDIEAEILSEELF